jgi:hypothetical protein
MLTPANQLMEDNSEPPEQAMGFMSTCVGLEIVDLEI